MATVIPQEYNFDDQSIKLMQGIVGIDFIYLEKLEIPYPFKQSRLIYIGLSEFTQNSIGRRLYGHLTGQSGNLSIRNYVGRHPAKFTCFHTFQLWEFGTLIV